MSKRGAREVASLDFAWRVHTAQEAWTAKVDVKASIVLALGAGALFAVLAAQDDGGILGHISAQGQVSLTAGVTLIVLSILTSAASVFPLLGPRIPDRERLGVIYFGHLRHQSSATIARRIKGLDAARQGQMIAEQLKQMAQRNWIKHRLLQVSLVLGLGGAAATLASIVIA